MSYDNAPTVNVPKSSISKNDNSVIVDFSGTVNIPGTFVPNAAISKDSPIVKEVLQNPDYDKVSTDIQGITVRKNYKDLLLMVNRDDSPGLYTNLSDKWLFKED